jgi:hypothetical protein
MGHKAARQSETIRVARRRPTDTAHREVGLGRRRGLVTPDGLGETPLGDVVCGRA